MRGSSFFLATVSAIALGFAPLPAAAAGPVVEMRTSSGRIVIELDPERAPKTVDNFLRYAGSGFYNGTIFHRVIAGFMIQGGGFDKALREKPTRPPIPNEAKNGLKNVAGSIAMARRPDPNSASAQFFINLVDNPNLDYPSFDGWGYAVFGRVVEGLDVVQKIGAVATGSVGRYQDVPNAPVVIESVSVLPAPTRKENP